MLTVFSFKLSKALAQSITSQELAIIFISIVIQQVECILIVLGRSLNYH